MQVRIANRQDEKAIRELAEAFSIAENASFDLKGSDRDLVNIEANYFGKEGLFLVVEEEGELKGFAGARSQNEETLSIERFQSSLIEAEEELLKVIVAFAPRLLYSGIECGDRVRIRIRPELLESFGFSENKKTVTPDF
ncbi:hypothetical protein GC174_14450 [bacterium]|nr:hypothetical protein [bacterium]